MNKNYELLKLVAKKANEDNIQLIVELLHDYNDVLTLHKRGIANPEEVLKYERALQRFAS